MTTIGAPAREIKERAQKRLRFVGLRPAPPPNEKNGKSPLVTTTPDVFCSQALAFLGGNALCSSKAHKQSVVVWSMRFVTRPGEGERETFFAQEIRGGAKGRLGVWLRQRTRNGAAAGRASPHNKECHVLNGTSNALKCQFGRGKLFSYLERKFSVLRGRLAYDFVFIAKWHSNGRSHLNMTAK
jgi:hypothetical protein